MLRRFPTSVLLSVAILILLFAVFHFLPVVQADWWTSLAPFVATIVMLIGIHLHRQHQHRAELTGDRLKWLLDEGLTIEQRGAYHGLKGMYRGYFTRIYIDSDLHSTNHDGLDLGVLIYFQPMRTAEGKRDMRLLRRIENDLLNESNWFDTERITCHAIHMRSYTRFNMWTTKAKVKKRIDRTVERAMHYGLKPWPEADVELWVREAPDLHGPDNEAFRKAVADQAS